MKIPSGEQPAKSSSTPPTPFTADQLESLALWLRSKGYTPATVDSVGDLSNTLGLAFDAGAFSVVRFIEIEAKAMKERKP